MDELKKLLAEMHAAFEGFKSKNDERLAQIEAKGHADPLVEAQVDKINAKLTELSEKIAAQQEDVRGIETTLARPNVGPNGGDQADVSAAAREFFSAVRDKPIENATPEDIESLSNYGSAFRAYMRRGENGLTPDIRAALSVGSDPDGGYWVLPDTTGRIVELIYETSPMRQFADVQNIGTDALEGIDDLDEAGGGWTGETTAITETTTPEIGKWRIPAHEMYAEPKATQKMLDDSTVNVEAWLAKKVAKKFSRMENTGFVTGDGVAKPRGFLTYTAGTPAQATWNVIEQTNTGAAGAFHATLPGDVFHTVMGLLKAEYTPGAVFAMNRTALAATRKIKDGDGTYLWEKSFQANQPFMLLGHPVALFEDMPVIAADSLSIAFANFGVGYQIVDRIGVRVLRDPYTSKPYVKFYTTKRTGGDVVNFEAIKLIKFAA